MSDAIGANEESRISERRHFAVLEYEDYKEALNRLREALNRLQEERDEARKERDEFKDLAAYWENRWSDLRWEADRISTKFTETHANLEKERNAWETKWQQEHTDNEFLTEAYLKGLEKLQEVIDRLQEERDEARELIREYTNLGCEEDSDWTDWGTWGSKIKRLSWLKNE